MPLQNYVDGTDPKIMAAWLNAIDAFYVTLFSSATTAAAARTALSVYSTTQVDAADAAVVASSLQKTGGTMTGAILLQAPVNDTLVPINSATSTTACQIWSIAGGDASITGTSTITGFAAAPIAGARRTLYPTDNCGFTAGANMLIKGVPSGSTVFMNTYAKVEVLAITTTQFALEYSLAGTATLTSTGHTVAQTCTAAFSVRNGVVHCYIPGITGTSNTTGFTMTGLPIQVRPTNTQSICPLAIMDNSGYLATGYGTIDSSGVLTLSTTFAGVAASWTAANAKALIDSMHTWNLR